MRISQRLLRFLSGMRIELFISVSLVRECLSSAPIFGPDSPPADGDRAENNNDHPSLATAGVISQARMLKELVGKLNALRLDHTEFTCLKALVLFRPGQRLPEKAKHSDVFTY